MDGFEVVSAYQNGVKTDQIKDINKRLLEDTDILVTTTGNIDVCDSAMLQCLKKGAIVCNIGHFDNEIDTDHMRRNWRWEEIKPQVHQVFRSDANDDYLLLLAEGRLVNLGNATGHPSRIMDGSFANQVLAQIEMYRRGFADLPESKKAGNIQIEVLPKQLDEEVASCMVEGFGGVITKLADKQADYIGVPVNGPFKPAAYKY